MINYYEIENKNKHNFMEFQLHVSITKIKFKVINILV